MLMRLASISIEMGTDVKRMNRITERIEFKKSHGPEDERDGDTTASALPGNLKTVRAKIEIQRFYENMRFALRFHSSDFIVNYSTMK